MACSNGQLLCARELRDAAEAQGIDLSKEEDRTGIFLGAKKAWTQAHTNTKEIGMSPREKPMGFQRKQQRLELSLA